MTSGDGIVPGHPSQTTYIGDELIGAAVQEAEAGGAFVVTHRAWTRARADVRPQRREDRPPRHVPRRRQHQRARSPPARRCGCARDSTISARWSRGRPSRTASRRRRSRRPCYPEELEAQLDGIRKLQSNGVRFVAGGDFGHQWTKHGTYAAELRGVRRAGRHVADRGAAHRHRQRGPAGGGAARSGRRGLPRRPRPRRRRPHRRTCPSSSTTTASAPSSRAASRPAPTLGATWPHGPRRTLAPDARLEPADATSMARTAKASQSSMTVRTPSAWWRWAMPSLTWSRVMRSDTIEPRSS